MFIVLFLKIFIYLFIWLSGLPCGMWDLLVAARRLFAAVRVSL